MPELYPEIEPYNQHKLEVSPLHHLYVEECGNPQGKPVVFVHGGPGGGARADDRRFFNPEQYRIVLFDQRGCGRSTPHASLEDNTTWDLVADMEKIRTHLNIETWQVFGGSWGSTLALSYAIKHPAQVSELVLRGIFMLRRKELLWFYQEGCSRLFPDVWQEFLKPIPLVERVDLISAYHRRLTSQDEAVRLAAARAWSIWEGSTSKLVPDSNFIEHFSDARFAAAFARIECHYFVHGGFFPSENWIIENVEAIRHIRGTIVQGRYDVVCPPESAFELAQAWPEADLQIVCSAGHNAQEPGIRSALVAATDAYART
jgi:proline iminopeptidase